MKLIGAIHLQALLGYGSFTTLAKVINRAVEDARAFEAGGADALIVENTYDDPHRKTVGPETVAAMTLVIHSVLEAVKIPVGICVLWNDAKAALAVAKATGCSFVRVPIYTEARVTAIGVIEGNPYAVTEYRRSIGAEDVAIFADVQVKHSTPLGVSRSLLESALEALDQGADKLIITGTMTGNPPSTADFATLKKIPKERLLIGSGLSTENASSLKDMVGGAIVASSLLTNGRPDKEKVTALKKAVNE